MKLTNVPHGRGPQILKTLVEYGPMSVRGLSQILEPQIDRKSLRKALNRLTVKKFVEKRNDNLFRGAAVYYEITQNTEYWGDIAKVTGCPGHNMETALVRPAECFHSEVCAVWAEKIRRLFPGAMIIRDYSVKSSDVAKDYLLADGTDRESLPDFLLILAAGNRERTVCVAFEVERFCKSNDRLVRKLRNYTNESRLDGVVYICENDGVARKVSRFFNSRVRKDALRINNYGANFLIIRDSIHADVDNYLSAYNCDGQSVDMSQWLHILMKTNSISRNDSIFKYDNFGAPGGRSLLDA